MITGLPRLHVMTLAFRASPHDAGKPIHGGIFGGRYMLVRGQRSPSGLVGRSAYVVDSKTEVAVGMGFEESTALADARNTLSSYQPEDIAQFIEKQESAWKAKKDKPRLPSIQKRRGAIFAASEGKCHYCDTGLELDGAWHVEHRQPKSRGGSDESANLVAACGLCNLRKKDMTEDEFCAALGLRRKS